MEGAIGASYLFEDLCNRTSETSEEEDEQVEEEEKISQKGEKNSSSQDIPLPLASSNKRKLLVNSSGKALTCNSHFRDLDLQLYAKLEDLRKQVTLYDPVDSNNESSLKQRVFLFLQ